MKQFELTEEEKEIERAFEAGEYESVSDEEKKELLLMFKNASLKKKNINIRLSERDLHKLKVKALEQGMPYQTLVASVLHQYVNK